MINRSNNFIFNHGNSIYRMFYLEDKYFEGKEVQNFMNDSLFRNGTT